jgi:putative addiction module CopG family antidote
MNLALPDSLAQVIDAQLKSGKFESAEDVVAAALKLLQQEEHMAFAAGSLNALLEEGDRDIEAGNVIDGAAFFEELRLRSAAARRSGK